MAGVDFAAQPVHYEQITPADPAANASYVYTVPDNTACELIALYVNLVAAAVAHVVNVHVIITYQVTGTICQVFQIWGPLAGSFNRLSFALNLAYGHIGNIDQAGRQNLPDRLYLYSGNRIILSMANEALGDQFRNISLYLRSWIMD